MRVNVYALNSTYVNRLVRAWAALQANGTWRRMVVNHANAMLGTSNGGVDAAHNGPALLAWHRVYLHDFDLAMQRVDSGTPRLEVPYWPWHAEGSGWRTARIWSLFGGDGNPGAGYRVTSGPFATGGPLASWTATIYNSTTRAFQTRPGLVRRFASGAMPGAPGSPSVYDSSPWNAAVALSASFRRSEEVPHNTVHNLVGGDMTAITSPNDPLFFLHHSNVDRLWHQWQQRYGITTYLPSSGARRGHNLYDVMPNLISTGLRPADVLDSARLGHTYA